MIRSRAGWGRLAGALLAAAAGGCSPAVRPCPAPGSLERAEAADWSGAKAFEIGHLGRAPASCPEPFRPTVELRHAGADAWVYVVETTTAAAGEHGGPRVAVEPSPKGGPLHTRGPAFRAGPSGDRPRSLRLWRGYAYPVAVRGKEIVPLGAVRWGYERGARPEEDAPLPIEPVPVEEWPRHKGLLEERFPDWEFGGGKRSSEP